MHLCECVYMCVCGGAAESLYSIYVYGQYNQNLSIFGSFFPVIRFIFSQNRGGDVEGGAKAKKKLPNKKKMIITYSIYFFFFAGRSFWRPVSGGAPDNRL